MRIISHLKILVVSLVLIKASLAQVQMFEQGNSGIALRGGGQYHPDIMTGTVGLEYNIEGKFTLGGVYGQVASDTLFELSGSPYKINSKIFGGYGILELVEPDKVFPLSFSLISEYNYSIGQAEDAAGLIQNSHKQSQIGVGPQVGSRFFVGDKGTFTPFAEYKFSYVNIARRATPEDTEFWHDVGVTLAYSHMVWGEVVGLLIDPKLFIRIGDTESMEFYSNINVGVLFRLPSY